MANRIKIKEILTDKEGIHLLTDFTYNEKLQPKGQMLVDSDNLSFIYVLESEKEYIYVDLDVSSWPYLKEALENNQQIYLQMKDEFELHNLNSELQYLLENIRGNANYGEEMEKKVVELFSLDK
jgi:hypothetical protein